MTSSSAPPTAPASEPFRFKDAARLHARRFSKHSLASALRLLSADQRITHPDGGIALLTEAGHATRATTLFAATYVPSFLAMLYGFTIGSIPLIALTVPAMLVSALVLGSRCERQMRARRTFDTAGHPWVLSDVAAEPHLGIGNQLLAEAGFSFNYEQYVITNQDGVNKVPFSPEWYAGASRRDQAQA